MHNNAMKHAAVSPHGWRMQASRCTSFPEVWVTAVAALTACSWVAGAVTRWPPEPLLLIAGFQAAASAAGWPAGKRRALYAG